MAKIAMLSWPRLDPNSSVPSGWTTTSAVLFVPVKPAGSVGTVWTGFIVPAAAS